LCLLRSPMQQAHQNQQSLEFSSLVGPVAVTGLFLSYTHNTAPRKSVGTTIGCMRVQLSNLAYACNLKIR
jgi:hypothetical protein